RAISSTG
ncbi:putative oligogalacturonate-specific porin protein, partial [Vibrio parahaemolyticus VPTS-2010]